MSSPSFSYAFQPIVDASDRSVYSFEALIRGPAGEPASTLFSQISGDHLHEFDRRSRLVAIELAGRLGVDRLLNLNALPRSLYGSTDAALALAAAAARASVPLQAIVLEVTEGEVIEDHSGFADLISEYRTRGIRVAIDDFGAGHSGLNLLAEFQPDVLKLDMKLVRGIAGSGPRQSIVRAVCQVCDDLGIDVIAEGVETIDEFAWFRDEGVHLFQGYLFGHPSFESLAPPCFAALDQGATEALSE